MGNIISYDTIENMLSLIELKNSKNDRKDLLKDLLNHEDYLFEFRRYGGSISKEEFYDYLISLIEIRDEEINNTLLKLHHKYYIDAINNMEYYWIKLYELKERPINSDLHYSISLAKKGLPSNTNLSDLKIIFTIGIGPSFGYVYEDCIHFDFLQLCKDYSYEQFFSNLAHEIHHLGMNKIYQNLDMDNLGLEELYYLFFSGEGLAVKYCNNAKGTISKPVYNTIENIGLDNETWEYLNNDFMNTFHRFKEDIDNIRSGKINSRQMLEEVISNYWMNPNMEYSKLGQPSILKHTRLYSFGNDIWGVIHDVFGMDVVFDTILNPHKFRNVYNSAVKLINLQEITI